MVLLCTVASFLRVMLRRGALGLARRMSTMSITPVEDAMRIKVLSSKSLQVSHEADECPIRSQKP